jgi:hypothetical protein
MKKSLPKKGLGVMIAVGPAKKMAPKMPMKGGMPMPDMPMGPRMAPPFAKKKKK